MDADSCYLWWDITSSCVHFEPRKEASMKTQRSHLSTACLCSVTSVAILALPAITAAQVPDVAILYVHGDVGYAIQEFRCCGDPCNTCDVYPQCDGEICPDLICSSWEYPCKYLQDALARAREIVLNPLEPETVEIWVAATAPNNPYRPHMSSEYHAMLSADPPINPCAWGHVIAGSQCDQCAGWSFHLQNNVEIYGGFPIDSADEVKYGSGGATMNDRNWETYTTVLSGDSRQLAVNDSAILHAGPDIDATAVIDGLTVQSSAGSAFLATDARPRVLGCTFISATRASVQLRGESLIVFDRCTFQSPASEAIKADDSAIVYCVDE
jgi:hypothetical protein